MRNRLLIFRTFRLLVGDVGKETVVGDCSLLIPFWKRQLKQQIETSETPSCMFSSRSLGLGTEEGWGILDSYGLLESLSSHCGFGGIWILTGRMNLSTFAFLALRYFASGADVLCDLLSLCSESLKLPASASEPVLNFKP